MLATIFKSSSLYAIGTAARAATSIIMLPIYTRYLEPEVYGTAELLNIILDLTVLLMGAHVIAGMFKFHADAKTPQDKNAVISTTLWLGLAVNCCAIVVLWLLAPKLSAMLSKDDFIEPLRWFAFTLAFGCISELGMNYYRIKNFAVTYLSVSLVKLAIQTSANIYFIVFKDLGLWGIIYSALLASSIQSAWMVLTIVPKVGIRFSKSDAGQLIRFGFPLIVGSIAMYYITFADRYLIQHYHDTAVVGVYALGYKFGFMLLSLVWAPFMGYWGAKQFEHAKEAQGAVLFGQVFEVANFLLWLAATAMLLFSPPLIRFMADPSYYSAIDLVPYILFAYVCIGWTEFHRFGLFESKNTAIFNRYNWYTVVVISIGYFSLIPPYGAVGAAIATLLALAFRFFIIYRKSQQYFAFSSPWLKILCLYLGSLLGLIICNQLFVDESSDFLVSAMVFLVLILVSFAVKAAPLSIGEVLQQGRKLTAKFSKAQV